MKFAFALLAAVLVQPGPAPSARVAALGHEFSGPYQFANLTLFLIHGADTAGASSYLTLDEALRGGMASVREKDQGTSLRITNRAERPIYLQSGDLVQGGRQDRAIATDSVIPPGEQDVPVLCVERGRSSAAGKSGFRAPGPAAASAPSGALKLAIRSGAQEKVWEGIARLQEKLAEVFGCQVAAEPSPTSLVLTMENETLQQEVQGIVAKLASSTEEHEDARGLAVAVDGRLRSIDVYESHSLFERLLPTLLGSAATEALSQRTREDAGSPAPMTAVLDCIKTAKDGKARTEQRAGELRIETFESGPSLLSETWVDESLVHASYLLR